MPTVYCSPFGPVPQFELTDGTPAVGYKVFTYVAGSVNTKQTTYTDYTGTSANTNPIVLNALGQPSTQIWLAAGQAYKFVLAPATDTDPPTSPVWTVDYLRGINDASVSIDQWVAGPAPTYVSGTQFTLSGDQTSTFSVGRRVKTTNSGGTVYGTITVSSYAALTTITIVADSGSLDSGLSAVSYGLLSSTGQSISPRAVAMNTGKLVGRTTAGIGGAEEINPAGNGSGLSFSALLLKNIALPTEIRGGTYQNNAGDPTNDLDIAATSAADATGAYWMVGSALTKQSDAAWAVGNNAGALDTGAVGNNEYFIWMIVRSDTGVVDYLFSLSATAPTMPGSYDYKRLIGWFKRSGGTIVAMKTYEMQGGGLELLWSAPTLDINLANTLTTARRTDAVKVPTGFSVTAILNAQIYDAAVNGFAWVYCPDQADGTPSSSAAPLGNVEWVGGTQRSLQTLFVRTNTSAQVAARSTVATTDEYFASTLGFQWNRRP